MTTHMIPYDSPGRLKAQALCGVYAYRNGQHSPDPTCPECRAAMAATDAMLEAEKAPDVPAAPATVKRRAPGRQESYQTSGVVDDGKLKVQHREAFERALTQFPDGPVVVEVKVERPQRSSQQNRFWHGVVVPLFAEHCGYDVDEMKDVLALHLLPKEISDPKTGEVFKVPGHTSKLTTKEFNDLIERAQRLGAEYGIYIPNPNEVAA